VKNSEFFFAARDDDGALIGFYFLEPRDGALFYGFGMRLDLTGRGLREHFVLAGLESGRLRYGARRVVLHVAAFNERAIRLYRRLGLDETGRHVKIFDAPHLPEPMPSLTCSSADNDDHVEILTARRQFSVLVCRT
jgi:RimJ/RimL family protein N-acetyltransferase